MITVTNSESCYQIGSGQGATIISKLKEDDVEIRWIISLLYQAYNPINWEP